MSAIVGELPINLLPDEVIRAIVRLRMAAAQHTDYKEVQVALDLRDEGVLPRVYFICNLEGDQA